MSSSNNNNPTYLTYDITSLENNTTFVQAEPSNFRAVVQRLTGSSSSASSRPAFDMGGQHDTASFKLHERRQYQGSMRKLEMIKLNNNNYRYHIGPMNSNGLVIRPKGGNYSIDMVSPVSTLDGLGLELRSPSPMISEEKERSIIAEKGFYLHANTSNNTRNCNEPQLLPLFPLYSPRD